LDFDVVIKQTQNMGLAFW